MQISMDVANSKHAHEESLEKLLEAYSKVTSRYMDAGKAQGVPVLQEQIQGTLDLLRFASRHLLGLSSELDTLLPRREDPSPPEADARPARQENLSPSPLEAGSRPSRRLNLSPDQCEELSRLARELDRLFAWEDAEDEAAEAAKAAAAARAEIPPLRPRAERASFAPRRLRYPDHRRQARLERAYALLNRHYSEDEFWPRGYVR
ncbi:hypothetical protein BO82DRAFT_406793 [Aspergillus uvarum CBS 121591]|uniref:Uncharacterized protein n=1 Tax=Aspergillus uvarum CBS 121591 TaxID=1448315 RepID=A0A319BVX7_9EURO|nr:hypothetical protein BO82DRAFT_406793 [Aspergillus uvarum CBS 121591]PYH76845.1 hypothetical protein BO82DRAFT_406793 [Aspergillus uvarum CBS 121591]